MRIIQTMIPLFVTISGGYLLLLLFMFLFQNKLIFLPSSEFVITPKDAGLNAQDLWIQTDDGERIHGWFFPDDSSNELVVFSHGNAGNISNRLDIVKFLHEAGFSVLIYDYRGYGQSSGKPSESGIYKDVEAVIEFLITEKRYSENQLVMYGRSMGGAVASYAASEFHVGGLVLDSAFKNIKTMIGDLYPFVPAFLASYEFPTAIYLRKLTGIPVMIMHSPNDSIVDISHGKSLFGIANEPKQFVELRGGHNDNFHASVDIYRKKWNEFRETVQQYRSENLKN